MNTLPTLRLIISGGQTGVDRAALDAAMRAGIPCGGWCPKGRRSEDRVIPARYPLRETGSAAYPVRTEKNITESDATLILHDGKKDRGTALTATLCRDHGKPFLEIDISNTVPGKVPDTYPVVQWLEDNKVAVLNVAGNRASFSPGIEKKAEKFLERLFKETTVWPQSG